MYILDYLFRPIPGSPFQFYIPLLILGILLIAAGFAIIRLVRKRKEDRAFRKLMAGVPTQCFWTGFLILINIGARYERFPLVGSRFVMFLILGYAVYAVCKNIHNYRKKLPIMREQFKESPVGKKYTTKKY